MILDDRRIKVQGITDMKNISKNAVRRTLAENLDTKCFVQHG